jgi:hypothetical protein
VDNVFLGIIITLCFFLGMYATTTVPQKTTNNVCYIRTHGAIYELKQCEPVKLKITTDLTNSEK